MFLLTLIVLDLDPKLGDLLFMIVFSFVEFFYVIEIELLSLFAASLLKKHAFYLRLGLVCPAIFSFFFGEDV